MLQEVTKIKKRDGRIADFKQEKITQAIFKALTITGQGDEGKAKKLSDRVVKVINRRFKKAEIPEVEQVQDIVEEVLIIEDLVETAKSYILYREQRRRMRETEEIYDEAVEIYDKYINEMDWQVKENSNMGHSLQGLNHYGVSTLTKRYWLNKIYPKQIREAVQDGDFHIHDLDTLGCYCMGWDLYDLLKRGFGGVYGKVASEPPKHLRTAIGQVVNFLFSLQGECAGAIAFSNFDTLLAPFIRYDKLDYPEVKQCMQEFMFNMATPTRVGFQCPFSNVTLDLRPSPAFAVQPVIIGGEPQKETYKEFTEEMKLFDKAFYEVMMEGDKNDRPFHFPIPTINITKDFPWDDPDFDLIFQASAKYGTNYFANYINSDMSPDDVKSMCCRLRLNLAELQNRGGGGLFGSGNLTGSIGVVTINMPRIGYLSKTKKDFFQRLDRTMDLAKESLEIKRSALDDLSKKGLYPYSRHYLEAVEKVRHSSFGNHFSTIGLVGMNECLLNFLGEDMGSNTGKNFTAEVMDYMRKKLVKYQQETGNLYNLEATPAESTGFRLCLKDREKYPDIIAAGTEKTPYYTNSTMLPVNYTDDVFEVLELQDKIQCKYTGGVVTHVFVGEKISDIKTVKALIKKIFENFHLPYISITPTFSICPSHGYLSGEHWTCPKCTIEQVCEVYSRVVGFYRPVSLWNDGKRAEWKDRKPFEISK